MMTNKTKLGLAAALTAGLTAWAMPVLAHGDQHHDHSQHHHSQILKIGTAFEAGIDLVDWRKPTKACELHPGIVSNQIGGSCPITASAKFNRPTTAPKGAASRLGLVLLPSKKPQQPILDAKVEARWGKGKPVAMSTQAGYYWVDLPPGVHGPVTLTVSHGKVKQTATIPHLH